MAAILLCVACMKEAALSSRWSVNTPPPRGFSLMLNTPRESFFRCVVLIEMFNLKEVKRSN